MNPKKFACKLSSRRHPKTPYIVCVVGADRREDVFTILEQLVKDRGLAHEVKKHNVTWKVSPIPERTGVLYEYEDIMGAAILHDLDLMGQVKKKNKVKTQKK
jgi:hypothetical protein